MTPDQRANFIRSNTTILPVPLVPEISLHLAHEAVPLWQKTEEQLGEMGLPPPFWAFAWAGGQALARYVLDHTNTVRNKRVIDLASGSGLVAIAAMKADATHVLAADIDDFAVQAIGINAALNFPPPCGEGSRVGVAPNDQAQINSVLNMRPTHTPALPTRGREQVSATTENLLLAPAPPADTILVGDLFYEKQLGTKVFDWLSAARANGTHILIGDPGRSYLPKDKLVKLAEYNVPVTRDLEDAEIKRTAVWTLA